MYGIFTYIWVIFRENVGKYSIHGAYGLYPTTLTYPLHSTASFVHYLDGGDHDPH